MSAMVTEIMVTMILVTMEEITVIMVVMETMETWATIKNMTTGGTDADTKQEDSGSVSRPALIGLLATLLLLLVL